MALVVVPTPIGNLEDITLRALRVLSEADLVACEDTRRTGRLLAHHGIKNDLVSYHEHNEERLTPSSPRGRARRRSRSPPTRACRSSRTPATAWSRRASKRASMSRCCRVHQPRSRPSSRPGCPRTWSCSSVSCLARAGNAPSCSRVSLKRGQPSSSSSLRTGWGRRSETFRPRRQSRCVASSRSCTRRSSGGRPRRRRGVSPRGRKERSCSSSVAGPLPVPGASSRLWNWRGGTLRKERVRRARRRGPRGSRAGRRGDLRPACGSLAVEKGAFACVREVARGVDRQQVLVEVWVDACIRSSCGSKDQRLGRRADRGRVDPGGGSVFFPWRHVMAMRPARPGDEPPD